ncbi:MAG TPA: KamA family radical SAM protein [Chlorobaculum parvum]|uniref:KamA family radical SAM protein n=1 Tax=Chlorobaculum parvum TaxID=274539 RepID=A0A7C5HIV2_9CHLB|nr:KamA family radical SAM protein [Chlorobaculum parvum]
MNNLCNKATLEAIPSLSNKESDLIQKVAQTYPMKVTEYYLGLIREPGDPIYKQCIPSEEELSDPTGQSDPLQEDQHSPVPRLHHRYPDRVLLVVTNNCAIYCRFCTRKRNISDKTTAITDTELARVVEYLNDHQEVHDVLISGGDPFSLPLNRLEKIISAIRALPHIDFIRIGTRIPCVDPEQVTKEFCAMLKKYHPLYINVQFNSPEEITPRSQQACAMLADAGIQLGNQSVLLRGVNDTPEVIKKLVRKLLGMRVKPYYLFIADMVKGTGHFRTTVETGLGIIRSIQGWMSGMATPQLVIDLENGGGKVPLSPCNVIEKQDGKYTFRNFENKLYEYIEHQPSQTRS